MAGIFDFETPDQLDGITNPTADDRPRWSKKASSTPTRLFLKGTLYRVGSFTPFGALDQDFKEEEGRAR